MFMHTQKELTDEQPSKGNGLLQYVSYRSVKCIMETYGTKEIELS